MPHTSITRRRTLAKLFLFASAAASQLAACGGSGGGDGSGESSSAAEETPGPMAPGPAAPPAPPTARFAYSGSSAATLFEYSVDPSSGALTEIQSLTTDGAPVHVCMGARPEHVYAAQPANGEVKLYEVDTVTRALTLKGSFPAGPSPDVLALHPSGKFLCVGDRFNRQLSSYLIDPATGGLTLIGSLACDTGVLEFHPSGAFVFSAAGGGNLWSIAVDPGTGLLTQAASTPATFGIESLAVDPAGQALYTSTSNVHDRNVTAHGIDAATGALTQRQHLALDAQPGGLAVHPSGRYLYLATHNNTTPFGGDLRKLEIDPTTGSLTAGTVLTKAVLRSASISIDSGGGVVYVSSSNGSEIEVFSCDSANSGDLTPLQKVSVFGGGTRLALS
ncbi:lactonase family protein [Ramlibacter humi]|nr:beta-propeller fold lactonase family protein [Ramlibacter humi]